MNLIPTASQTVGPFFNFGLTTNLKLGVLFGSDSPGERIRVRLRVTDGEGAPLSGDAMIELWQADANGDYDPSRGFGRLETDPDGYSTFETIRPGQVGEQAPHITVLVFSRGVLKHFYTRLYFAGDPGNHHDAVLTLVPQARRATLLAQPSATDPETWNFNVCLQGEDETVFFDM